SPSCFGRRSAIACVHSQESRRVNLDKQDRDAARQRLHAPRTSRSLRGRTPFRFWDLRLKEFAMVKVLSQVWCATTHWRVGAMAVCALVLSGLAVPAHAQFQPKRERSRDLAEIADRMNANTLIAVTGNPGFIYSEFGNDLAAVLNNGDELRILPVVSQGGVQTIL